MGECGLGYYGYSSEHIAVLGCLCRPLPLGLISEPDIRDVTGIGRGEEGVGEV